MTEGQEITTETAKASGGYTLTDSYEGGGKALHLDGTASQWLNVTDMQGGSLLDNVEEMTVSYDIKNERTGTNWALYAAPNGNAQGNPNGEHYIGFLHKDGSLTVERYNQAPNTSRPANPSASAGSEWLHIDAVLTGEDTTIYVNGVERSRVESSYSLQSILGANSILQIGKANWGSGEYTQASIDNLKIWDKALTPEQLLENVPAAFLQQELDKLAGQIKDLTLENGQTTLPDYGGTVTWESDMAGVVMGEDGLTAVVSAPEIGDEDLTGSLTAVITLGNLTKEVPVPVTVRAQAGPDDPYGYLMVHFVEDSAGYAEKIYLDISRGDNPEQWDPLNGRNPILASNLGTTGTRDPFITYSPATETYYIIATDLRVFGGDELGWGAWTVNYSTKMNIWESKDLISWSDVRQIDVACDKEGNKLPGVNLGMMWAPEATWVDDYYGEGQGAFVVYWSSQQYLNEEQTERDGDKDIMWAATTDFTQGTWEFGGVMLEGGEPGCIDTNIIRDGESTYHVTKSQAVGEEIIMERTDAEKWWLADTDDDPSNDWVRIQTSIGADWYGAVEGPASFKDHSQENRWYLFVDDLPSPGYQPMISTDLDKGWEHLDTSDYFLTSNTKHGGVISLTKSQYDAIRAADATSAVETDLGTVSVEEGSAADTLTEALPKTAEVNLAYDMGVSELPVVWDVSNVDLSTPDTYAVTGVVQSISANTDAWAGDGGSTAYNAPNRVLYSSRAIEVTAEVNVTEAIEPGAITDTTDPEDNAGNADLADGSDFLADAVLTEEDKAEVAAGTSADIYLTVEDITSQVSDEDKALAEEAAGAAQIGLYLDVTLWKQIGQKPAEEVENTGSGVTITFEVPENLRNTDPDTERTFRIVRVHGDTAEVIASSYDEATGIITFVTDRFSTYALAYTDKAVEDPTPDPTPDPTLDPDKPAAGNPDNAGKDAGTDTDMDKDIAPQTGDTANLALPIAGIGAALILAVVAGKRRYR